MLEFKQQEWQFLEDSGLQTCDLPGDLVAQVLAIKRAYTGLSANDCFALVTATCWEDSILLTGDNLLRKVALARGIRAHGVLWVIDDLGTSGLCQKILLKAALETWREDKTVFLPRNEIEERLHKLRQWQCRHKIDPFPFGPRDWNLPGFRGFTRPT